jgi:hypothetical protein
MMANMSFGQKNVVPYLKQIWKELTFDVYILSDKTKKITYIVPSSIGTSRYLVERLCGNDVTMTKIKRIYVWELRKFTNGQDAVCINVHKTLTRFFDDGLLVPEFVGQVFDIGNKEIQISSKNLKRVCKYNYEVSNDPGMFRFFYEKMYFPYVKKRYADSAQIDSFDSMESFFKNGELIFIKLGGEYIAAQLSEIDGDMYRLRRNGVLSESFVKDGALVATYYFSMLRAKDMNAKTVYFGGSNPFLLDGVLRHKNVWGTRIFETEDSRRFIYLKNVLFDQPFIYVDEGKLKAVIFSDDNKLIKEYASSGLEFTVVEKANEQENETVVIK